MFLTKMFLIKKTCIAFQDFGTENRTL